MKKKLNRKTIAALVLALLLATALAGCGRQKGAAETVEPAVTAAPASQAEPAQLQEAEVVTGRQDGERFEDVIMLEGMEETVHYEHIRNDAVGVEMDYDYELFVRRSGADGECFVSCWDRPENPENYLELTYRLEDADTVAASVREAFSLEYDLLEGTRELDRAGSCIRMEAAVLRGTGQMADRLQVVYIIPASDGCRVATEHFAAEASEGFGRRFSYMLNTLAVIDRRA